MKIMYQLAAGIYSKKIRRNEEGGRDGRF